MNLLLELSLHGSLVFLLVWFLDYSLAGRMRAAGRRVWWIAVPCAFLISFPLAILPAPLSPAPGAGEAMGSSFTHAGAIAQRLAGPLDFETNHVWFRLWLIGAAGYLGLVVLQARATLRRWSRERLSTDSRLLELLEDAKEQAGITAPIGLVVSSRLSAPAILGWLRPRILLPSNLVSSFSRDQLRAVLLHELAHFRSLDIPLNWLFTLARALHWFNPFAHLAFRAWAHFREEAADEAALAWLKGYAPASYGEVLLLAVQGPDRQMPFSALALGESIYHLKKRITMITHYPDKSPRLFLAATVLLLLVLGFIARPVQADDSDPRPAAVAAMQTWLAEIDQSQFDQSWKDASASFQKAVTSAQWTAALQSVRTPLGKIKARQLASSLHQTSVPSSTGNKKGDFVIAQFDSSFDNLAYAVETITFEKAPDGTWKAAGYYIKPKI